MKFILFSLAFTLSCSSFRGPAQFSGYQEISFRNQDVKRDFLRQTYPHLSEESFAAKFNSSLERPLLFFRSYVNSYYAETTIRGPLNTPVFCYGDPHPENFGFLSFNQAALYIFNDLDDSGLCPIGLDILRYFSALRLTIDDEEKIAKLADIFTQTVQGKKLQSFEFKKPNLYKQNLSNLKKNTKNDQFIEKKNLTLLSNHEKRKINDLIQPQLGRLRVLDIALYQKNDGGSAGLKRYWLVVEIDAHKELLELKQLTLPAVSWTGLNQNVDQRQTPLYIWGGFPDYYGHITLDNNLYMLRSRADDYIDLAKLSKQEEFKLLSYQVQLLALHHRDNLNQLGGIELQWIIEGSRKIALRYQKAFNHYKR